MIAKCQDMSFYSIRGLGCGVNLKGMMYSVSHILQRKNQISFYEDLVVLKKSIKDCLILKMIREGCKNKKVQKSGPRPT